MQVRKSEEPAWSALHHRRPSLLKSSTWARFVGYGTRLNNSKTVEGDVWKVGIKADGMADKGGAIGNEEGWWIWDCGNKRKKMIQIKTDRIGFADCNPLADGWFGGVSRPGVIRSAGKLAGSKVRLAEWIN